MSKMHRWRIALLRLAAAVAACCLAAAARSSHGSSPTSASTWPTRSCRSTAIRSRASTSITYSKCAKAPAAPPAASAAVAAAISATQLVSDPRTAARDEAAAPATRWLAAALFGAGRRRPGRRAAGGSRRSALPPLRGRRRHRPGPLGAGAQEVRRFAFAVVPVLRRPDLQRLDRRAVDRRAPTRRRAPRTTSALDYLHGNTLYSVGFINSNEPDYKSNTGFFSISQSMFGDLTTVSFGFTRGWDKVGEVDNGRIPESYVGRRRPSQLVGRPVAGADAQPAAGPELRDRRERRLPAEPVSRGALHRP